MSDVPQISQLTVTVPRSKPLSKSILLRLSHGLGLGADRWQSHVSPFCPVMPGVQRSYAGIPTKGFGEEGNPFTEESRRPQEERCSVPPRTAFWSTCVLN